VSLYFPPFDKEGEGEIIKRIFPIKSPSGSSLAGFSKGGDHKIVKIAEIRQIIIGLTLGNS
jgi:hypothetical protein